jgi:hypothetical protein
MTSTLPLGVLLVAIVSASFLMASMFAHKRVSFYGDYDMRKREQNAAAVADESGWFLQNISETIRNQEMNEM